MLPIGSARVRGTCGENSSVCIYIAMVGDMVMYACLSDLECIDMERLSPIFNPKIVNVLQYWE